MIQGQPAQRVLVQRMIDWDLVSRRLAAYRQIGRAFPLELLRSHADRPPYYCHYMAWRLGTWASESLFEHFDRLLCVGSGLEGWEAEFASLRSSGAFEEFWSLIWQLQVANLFDRPGTKVVWNREGPDLAISPSSGPTFFVECYSYRKSFGISSFVEGIVERVHPKLCVKHQWYLPLALPKDSGTVTFLDELLTPLADDAFIEAKVADARRAWPVLLEVPPAIRNFYLVMEGTDIDAYRPGMIENAVGDPDRYINVALREVVGNKVNANKLSAHRPNLLCVNMLLSTEFFVAMRRRADDGGSEPEVELVDPIDALHYTSCGIDSVLSGGAFRSAIEKHPFMVWLESNRLLRT